MITPISPTAQTPSTFTMDQNEIRDSLRDFLLICQKLLRPCIFGSCLGEFLGQTFFWPGSNHHLPLWRVLVLLAEALMAANDVWWIVRSLYHHGATSARAHIRILKYYRISVWLSAQRTQHTLRQLVQNPASVVLLARENGALTTCADELVYHHRSVRTQRRVPWLAERLPVRIPFESLPMCLRLLSQLMRDDEQTRSLLRARPLLVRAAVDVMQWYPHNREMQIAISEFLARASDLVCYTACCSHVDLGGHVAWVHSFWGLGVRG